MSAGQSRYGWVIVAAGALMTCVAFGAVFALAVFLQPMTDATGWSRAGISGAMTLVFLAMGLGGFVWGTLSDRYGAKRVLVAGLLVQALAAGAFGFASRLNEFYAVAFFFGLAYGGVMPLYAVRARVTGILLKRNFLEGGPVKQGESLYTIDPAPFQAALARADADVGVASARLGQARRESARLRALVVDKFVSQKLADDAASAEAIGDAELPNSEGRPRPGQFVRLTLNGATRPNAVLVPQRAVLEGPQGKFVYVVDEKSTAQARVLSHRPVQEPHHAPRGSDADA